MTDSNRNSQSAPEARSNTSPRSVAIRYPVVLAGGGAVLLVVATILTMIVVPVLYASFFGAKPPDA